MVTLDLTDEEAEFLRSFTGGLIGGGILRELSDGIFHKLVEDSVQHTYDIGRMFTNVEGQLRLDRDFKRPGSEVRTDDLDFEL